MRGTRTSGARARRRGFTLIELMVTVLVGSIVIAGVYMMYTTSARGYRAQNHALDAIGQIRMGLKQIKADLRSAGFNAPAQSLQEAWVSVPSGDVLSAIAIDVDPTSPVIEPSQNTNIAPQRLRILGDFWSQRSYVVELVGGAVVTLRWDVAVDGEVEEFDRIFVTGRLLRLEAYGSARTEEFIAITDSAFNAGLNPTVTVAQAPGTISGLGTGTEASVLGYVQYSLKDTGSTSGLKLDLVREELDITGAAVPNTGLVVAENIVDLQFYDLCMNTAAIEAGTMRQVPVSLACFQNLAGLQAAGRSLAADGTNQSELLRGVTVKMASRASHEEEDLLFAQRDTIDEPLRAYDLAPDVPGAARVFEMASAVALISVQARRQ